MNRRAVTGNSALRPVDIVEQLVEAAWREYDAIIQEAEKTFDPAPAD